MNYILSQGSKLPTTVFIVSIRPCIPKVFSNWTRGEMDIYDLRGSITTPNLRKIYTDLDDSQSISYYSIDMLLLFL